MEPDVSIGGSRMIRVAVVAVGNIPAAQLQKYLAFVLRHKRVRLRNVFSFYEKHQKSPFMQQPWDTGSLCFKFLVGGCPPSPWEDFQANRKCLGVIGLLDCPTSPDMGAAYEQFTAICRAYPSAHERRCFAFCPSDEQVELDDKSRHHLVLLPPDSQMLELHMQTLMLHFAASLLMAFENWVLHADPGGAMLTTPLDSQASLHSEEVSKAKKRRLGRIQKTIGDYCLLAGSPVDANAHYATAIDLARLTGDIFWQAGAIEGSVSSLVTDRDGEEDDRLEEEVKYNYSEIIQLYHRERAMSFELEAILKLARFLCRKELSRVVVDLLMRAVEGSKSLMDASDRLVLNVEVARVFGTLGYQRKAAFYVRQVAQLYQLQDSCWAAMSALQVLRLTANTYHVQSKTLYSTKRNTLLDFFLGTDGQPMGKENKPVYSSLEVGAYGQWSTLQMDILHDMLAAAVRARDPFSAWSAAAQMLRRHYPLVTPVAQYGLATALTTVAEHLPHGMRCSNPALPFVRLHSYPCLPPEMEVVKRTPGRKEWWVESSASGPFIYTPFSSKSGSSDYESEVIWVVGEPVQVLVDLSNPCAFVVSVESISLSAEPGHFKSFPVSVVLPPNTSQVLSLSGVPISAGHLVVRGCVVECFGVVTEHLFEEAEDHASGVAVSDPFRSFSGPKVGPSDIIVVPPLPLLVVQVLGGEGAVVLYEGEIRELQIRFANAGVVPVVEAMMTLIGKHKEYVLSLGHEVLNAALPLLPGASVVLPVRLKAGQPSTEVENIGVNGARFSTTKPAKDPASPMLVIYYAGPAMQTSDDQSHKLPPGRKLDLPLNLHVLRGIDLVRAQLLSMDVPAYVNIFRPNTAAVNRESDGSLSNLVQIDPYIQSWGLLLLEIELQNLTNILVEITVNLKKETEIANKSVSDGTVIDFVYPCTRIDQDHSARVLIPLERFELRNLDKAVLARSLARKGVFTKCDPKCKDRSNSQAKAELNAKIEELSSRVNAKWHSGRSCGELLMKDIIRETLVAAIEILLPDPLTFAFRLARCCQPSLVSGSRVAQIANSKQTQQKLDDGGKGSLAARNGHKDFVVAHELTALEMLVRNNTTEEVTISLSACCQDVTGASCLGSSGSAATVVWAGAVNGVDVEIPALGEVVHAFALYFLVPGQYTLLGAAVISDLNDCLSREGKLPLAEVSGEQICYSGPPFAIDVIGTN